VPFLEPATISTVEPCREPIWQKEIVPEDSTGSNREPKSAPRWNFETRSLPEGPGWLPEGLQFVPRKLWRVELEARDPFAVYGRQVIYIDQLLRLPVYKFVYDRSGRLWKVIIAPWGVAQQGEVVLPLLPKLIVMDRLRDEVEVVDLITQRYCSAFPTEVDSTDFDPSYLGPRVEASAVVAPLQ
jgi:Protein of unknown function (DUF1329)